jgi:5-methylcytosine-specific restriction endonuclease McrA
MYYPIVVCSYCGYDEHSPLVEVHHIDSDQKNNSPENLMWLCSRCHRAVTLGLAQIEKREFQWKTANSLSS